MLSMPGYTLALPMPAGREAFLTRAGMVFCQLWQAFEKTLGRLSVASFAPRRFSLVPLRRRAFPADAAGHHARTGKTSEGQKGAKFSRWENFASSRSAGMGKASTVKYVT